VNPEWKSRYETAVTAAQKAGRLALSYFDQGLAVEWKPDHSPVTLADREAERLLRSALLERFPHDGFLGEESGEHHGNSGFRWIIDPIDGTRSFVRNIPIWATLVGLEFKNEPIAGVCVLPTMNQTFRALRGDGAFRDERRIRVSDVASMSEAMMFYSSISWFVKTGMRDQFLDLAVQTQRQRGFGDFYGHILVAQGSGEFMVEHGVHSWDVAALLPIVEEAGGRFTDWNGVRSIHTTDVIASNGSLHEEALRLLTGGANQER
jgi:histidinol-phosphatase